MYLTDLVFIEEGNKDTIEDGLINWTKRRMFAGTIKEILHYQQGKYCLIRVPAVRRFLKDRIESSFSVINRYNTKNDDILYSLSQWIEPKEGSTEQNAPECLNELKKLFGETEMDNSRATILVNHATLNNNVPLDINILPIEYQRLKYTFYYHDDEDNQHLHDLQTCTQLSLAFSHQIHRVQLPVNEELFIFDFLLKEQIPANLDVNELSQTARKNSEGSSLIKKISIYQRISQWFWRDDDGTIKPYKYSDIVEFSSMLLKGQSVTSINIGKHSYEIDLGRKRQKKYHLWYRT